MPKPNILVVDAAWWLLEDARTRGDLRKAVSMVRDRLQLRKPHHAVVILPKYAGDDPNQHRLINDFQKIMKLMGVAIHEDSSPESAMIGLRQNFLSGDYNAIWLSGRDSLIPLAQKGAILERNDDGDWLSKSDLSREGLSDDGIPMQWLALSGYPTPIPRMGPKKASELIKEFGDIKTLVSEAKTGLASRIVAQSRDTITSNLRAIQALWSSPSPLRSHQTEWKAPTAQQARELLDVYREKGWNDWLEGGINRRVSDIKDPLSLAIQMAKFAQGDGVAWSLTLKTGPDGEPEGIEIGRNKDPMIWNIYWNRENQDAMLAVLSRWLCDPKLPKVVQGAQAINKIVKRSTGKKVEGVVGDVQLAQFYAGRDKSIVDSSLVLEENGAALKEMTGPSARYYKGIDLPVSMIVGDMESRGLKVSRETLEENIQTLESQSKALEKQLAKWMGFSEEELSETDEFKKKVQKALGLKPGGSLDAEVLKSAAEKNPLAATLLEWRMVKKSLTSFMYPLMSAAGKGDKIFTTLDPNGAVTGRMTSVAPSLLNLPVDGAMGISPRSAFIPHNKDSLLVSVDYKQIEIALLAHISGEKSLIDAINEGKDVHAFTAADIFDVELTDVTAEQRSVAKAINFGIIYGMSAYGVAQKLGINEGKATKLISKHERSFPGIARYKRTAIEAARKQGYVTTLSGRRINIPGLGANQTNVRNAAERKVVNYTMQGSAAELIKAAMILCAKSLDSATEGALLMQVHDELVVEVKRDRLKQVLPKLARAMKEAPNLVIKSDLKVKLNIEAKCGNDLGHLAAVSINSVLKEKGAPKAMEAEGCSL